MGFLKKKRWQRRHLVEAFMKFIMRVSLVIVAGALGLAVDAVDGAMRKHEPAVIHVKLEPDAGDR